METSNEIENPDSVFLNPEYLNGINESDSEYNPIDRVPDWMREFLEHNEDAFRGG